MIHEYVDGESVFYEVMAWCPYRACTQFRCRECGHIDGSVGPVDCPCDELGLRGHGFPEEQPRPHVALKRR